MEMFSFEEVQALVEAAQTVARTETEYDTLRVRVIANAYAMCASSVEPEALTVPSMEAEFIRDSGCWRLHHVTRL